MPKVSVIIPVYNVEKYLRECLDSVVEQTLQDIEIICVNDGSTDNSLEILKEYASNDSRINIIDKPNSGYGHSMNIGIEKATGEYIGIVEPDDYIKQEMYETLYNSAKNNDLDFVKSDFYRFTGCSDNIKLFYNQLSKDLSFYNRVINVNEEIMPYYFIMNTWCGIYNRDFIEKYHIRHNETPGASFQDNGFWFQTFVYSKRAMFLNIPFYMNRRDNPNSSVYNPSKILTVCNEFSFIENLLKNNSDIADRDFGIFFHVKYLGYMAGYNRVIKKYKMMYLERFRKDFLETCKDKNFNKDLFTKTQLKKLNMILHNPKKFYRKSLNEISFWEKIFSITNSGIHKIITICGIKIKLRNKQKELLNKIKKLSKNLKTVQTENKLIKERLLALDVLTSNCLLNKEQIEQSLETIDNKFLNTNNIVNNLSIELKYINQWQCNYYKSNPDKYPVILTDAEKVLLCKYLETSNKYIEFGAGGSTFLALSNSSADIYSTEADKSWIDYLRSFNIIRNSEEAGRLKFYNIYIGKTKKWSYPEDSSCKNYYPEYSSRVFNDVSADTIFVDGRFRVACVLNSIIHSSNETKILLHDYIDRPYYHIIENYLDIIETADSLAVFKIKDNIDRNELEHLYEEYKYDVR